MLQNGSLRVPPFQFDADSDPAFHFDADPDPAFHFDSDPDSGSSFSIPADPEHWLKHQKSKSYGNMYGEENYLLLILINELTHAGVDNATAALVSLFAPLRARRLEQEDVPTGLLIALQPASHQAEAGLRANFKP